MSFDPYLELYVSRSIAHELKTATELAGLLVQVEGLAAGAPSTVEEWIAVDVMHMPRKKVRPSVWWGSVLFQVASCARFAANRTDKKADAHRVLACKVARVLENKRVAICRYGDDEVAIASMTVGPGEPTKLPPKADDRTQIVVVTFTASLQA